jgi:hypothetical protein
MERDASATMYCNTQGINNAGRKRKDRGRESALIISSKRTGRIYVQHQRDEDIVLEVFLGS